MSKLFFSVKCPCSPFPVLFQEPAKNPLALTMGYKHSAHATLHSYPRLACWQRGRIKDNSPLGLSFHMGFHPAVKCSVNPVFSSQSEGKDQWVPPQCETEQEGQTDPDLPVTYRSLQSCLSRTLPVLCCLPAVSCCILEKPKHRRTTAGHLACADRAGRGRKSWPCPAAV